MVSAERFAAGGEALGHGADGRIVFIRGGVPGDRLTVKTVEEKSSWSRVDVESVIEPASQRVEPPCPQRLAGCGGCDWQHVAVDAQLGFKVEVVRDALRRTARLPDADVRAGGTVAPEDYRTTVRVIGNASQRAAFRVERSHETIEAAPCLIAHPTLQTLVGAAVITPGLEVSLRVSLATGEATAFWDQRQGEVRGLPEFAAVGPRAHLTEEVAGFDFRVSSRSFFQSGPAAGELLIDSVKRCAPELDTAELVVDAYSGVGLFGLAACRPDTRLVALESAPSAVADCRFNLADRDAAVVKINVDHWKGGSAIKADVIIADPTRRGLGRAGVEALAVVGSPVISLVSCDPVAMARDAALLRDVGYQHRGTEVLDLFPQTHHVECVSRFVRE